MQVSWGADDIIITVSDMSCYCHVFQKFPTGQLLKTCANFSKYFNFFTFNYPLNWIKKSNCYSLVKTTNYIFSLYFSWLLLPCLFWLYLEIYFGQITIIIILNTLYIFRSFDCQMFKNLGKFSRNHKHFTIFNV